MKSSQQQNSIDAPAQVDDLIGLQKLREDAADGFVDCHGAQAAADDHDDRLVGMEIKQIPRLILVAGQQLLTDGGAGQDSLPIWKKR